MRKDAYTQRRKTRKVYFFLPSPMCRLCGLRGVGRSVELRLTLTILPPAAPRFLPFRCSLFDAPQAVEICWGVPRPDTFRRPRRAGRVKSAASCGGSGAARSHAQPSLASEHGEHGEHPPFDASEHRGTKGGPRRRPQNAGGVCRHEARRVGGGRSPLK
jgi:hypothetical protein